eukprot:3703081-Rhodomonas_salina.1
MTKSLSIGKRDQTSCSLDHALPTSVASQPRPSFLGGCRISPVHKKCSPEHEEGGDAAAEHGGCGQHQYLGAAMREGRKLSPLKTQRFVQSVALATCSTGTTATIACIKKIEVRHCYD